MCTLGSFLLSNIERYKERTALLFNEGTQTKEWSYYILGTKVCKIANWLKDQGIDHGDRVVIWAPNGPWWVATYFATLQLGAVVVPLDMRSSADFISRVVPVASPKLAIISAECEHNWKQAVPYRLIEDLAKLPDRNLTIPACQVLGDDTALIMFTSGTTGDPKGVILTHRNILSNVESTNAFVPILPDYRLLSVLPLSHMLEQTIGLLQPIKQGASVFYPETIQPGTLLRYIKEQHITNMLVVPMILQLFMATLENEIRKQGRLRLWEGMLKVAPFLPFEARGILFRQLHEKLGGKFRFFAVGGAFLDPQLTRKWELLGIRIYQGYGLTEAAPVVTGTKPGQNPASVGKPLKGVEVKLSEDDEILIRGANITPGYWGNPQTTANAFEDGWFHTGDLGYFDKDGLLYLKGRKKDLIVLTNGMKVYPEDIERILKQTPGIIEAVVVAYPQGSNPEVYAVIQCEPQVSDPQALIQEVNRKLAPHQRIKNCTVWQSADFPRTHTLKVKKNEIVRLLKEKNQSGPIVKDASPSNSQTTKTTQQRLLEIVADVAEISVTNLSAEKTLEEIGLDSLGRVNLLITIEEKLGVVVDETRVGSETTLAELNSLIYSEGNLTLVSEPPVWPRTSPAIYLRQVIQFPIFSLLKLFAPLKVCNRSVFADLEGPILLASNHSSYLDTLLILEAVPSKWRRLVVVAAAEDYFFSKHWLAVVTSLLFNAFPFSRAGAVRQSLKYTARLSKEGWSILIYPEGTRSPNGKVNNFKAGTGLLAAELGVPVLPVRVEGAFNILPKGSKFPRRGHVMVRFGRPLSFPKNEPYEQITEALEAAVRQL